MNVVVWLVYQLVLALAKLLDWVFLGLQRSPSGVLKAIAGLFFLKLWGVGSVSPLWSYNVAPLQRVRLQPLLEEAVCVCWRELSLWKCWG